MLVQAGSRALGVHGFGETLDFDPVDRCFAAMAAAAFVGLIAVVVWIMASTSASASKSARISRQATAEISTHIVRRSAPTHLARAIAAGGPWRLQRGLLDHQGQPLPADHRLFRARLMWLSGMPRRMRGMAPVGTRRLPMDPDPRARRDRGRLSESWAVGQQGQNSDDRKDSTDYHCNAPSPLLSRRRCRSALSR
jgi:hypothetical protein